LVGRSSVPDGAGAAIHWGFLETFKEYPPSQKVGSMNLDAVMESLTQSSGAK
jgi:hypothetical protein